MSLLRPARFAPRFVALLLIVVATSSGVACKRRAAAPIVEPVAKAPPAPTAADLAAEAAKIEDAKWLKLKNDVKNWKPRFESAIAKAEEALRLKSAEYDTEKDEAKKKEIGKKIRTLKNEAGSVIDELRAEADAIMMDKLWENAFKVESKRWEYVANKVNKGLSRF